MADAVQVLNEIAEARLARILTDSSGSLRRSRLKSFMRSYAGVPAAGRARREYLGMLEQEAQKKLEAIKKMRSPRAQQAQLKYFIRKYSGTRAAEEAGRLLQ